MTTTFQARRRTLGLSWLARTRRNQRRISAGVCAAVVATLLVAVGLEPAAAAPGGTGGNVTLGFPGKDGSFTGQEIRPGIVVSDRPRLFNENDIRLPYDQWPAPMSSQEFATFYHQVDLALSKLENTDSGKLMLAAFEKMLPMGGADTRWVDASTGHASDITLVIFRSSGNDYSRPISQVASGDKTGSAGLLEINPGVVAEYFDPVTGEQRAMSFEASVAHELSHSIRDLMGATPDDDVTASVDTPIFEGSPGAGGQPKYEIPEDLPVRELLTHGGDRGRVAARDLLVADGHFEPYSLDVDPFLHESLKYAVDASVEGYHGVLTADQLADTLDQRLKLALANPTEVKLSREMGVLIRPEYSTAAYSDPADETEYVWGDDFRLRDGVGPMDLSMEDLMNPASSGRLERTDAVASPCGSGSGSACTPTIDRTKRVDPEKSAAFKERVRVAVEQAGRLTPQDELLGAYSVEDLKVVGEFIGERATRIGLEQSGSLREEILGGLGATDDPGTAKFRPGGTGGDEWGTLAGLGVGASMLAVSVVSAPDAMSGLQAGAQYEIGTGVFLQIMALDRAVQSGDSKAIAAAALNLTGNLLALSTGEFGMVAGGILFNIAAIISALDKDASDPVTYNNLKRFRDSNWANAITASAASSADQSMNPLHAAFDRLARHVIFATAVAEGVKNVDTNSVGGADIQQIRTNANNTLQTFASRLGSDTMKNAFASMMQDTIVKPEYVRVIHDSIFTSHTRKKFEDHIELLHDYDHGLVEQERENGGYYIPPSRGDMGEYDRSVASLRDTAGPGVDNRIFTDAYAKALEAAQNKGMFSLPTFDTNGRLIHADPDGYSGSRDPEAWTEGTRKFLAALYLVGQEVADGDLTDSGYFSRLFDRSGLKEKARRLALATAAAYSRQYEPRGHQHQVVCNRYSYRQAEEEAIKGLDWAASYFNDPKLTKWCTNQYTMADALTAKATG